MSPAHSAQNASAPDYRPVTQAVVGALCDIVGAQHAIYDAPGRMLDYGHDEVTGEEYAHAPDVVGSL